MAASLSARPHRGLVEILINRRAFSATSVLPQVSAKSVSKKETIVASANVDEIVIPRKKKRDSLSVLRALASTVTRDPDAPHYRYMDDPFLIPTTNLAKKSQALSRESGKKAARYILENYSQWFTENAAAPSVEAFVPPQLAYSHTEASEAALKERIDKRRVGDAIEVYKKIKQENVEITEDTNRLFLELLCVYNAQDPPVKIMNEEFFFRRELGFEVKRPSKTWKDNGLAERVFDDLKEKTKKDSQNLIRGMARYLQTDKAFTMYDELMEKKTPIELGTFNELIRVSTYHHDTYETKWKQVETLLLDMQASGVTPDLTTFTNVLFSLSRMPVSRQAPGLVLQTLSEMRSLGVEPSLACWKYALVVFYPNDNSESNMLYKLVDYLQGKSLGVLHPDDGEFFVTAMKRCCVNLQDTELAMRIDALLSTAANASTVSDSRMENLYYSFFLRLLCQMETMENIMEVYQRVTPHLWTPNLNVMDELLKAVELQDGFQHLPLIWTDLLLFDFTRRAELLEKLLGLMAKKKQEEALQSQFCMVAEQLLERWRDDQAEDRPTPLSTGAMIGHMVTVAEQGENHDLAWRAFQTLRDHRKAFTGLPSDAAVRALLVGCLGAGEATQAVDVVAFMNTVDMAGVAEAAQSVLDSGVALTQAQKDSLANMAQ